MYSEKLFFIVILVIYPLISAANNNTPLQGYSEASALIENRINNTLQQSVDRLNAAKQEAANIQNDYIEQTAHQQRLNDLIAAKAAAYQKSLGPWKTLSNDNNFHDFLHSYYSISLLEFTKLHRNERRKITDRFIDINIIFSGMNPALANEFKRKYKWVPYADTDGVNPSILAYEELNWFLVFLTLLSIGFIVKRKFLTRQL